MLPLALSIVATSQFFVVSRPVELATFIPTRVNVRPSFMHAYTPNRDTAIDSLVPWSNRSCISCHIIDEKRDGQGHELGGIDPSASFVI